MHHPLRLRCDRSALSENYRQLCSLAGTQVGAAIKADGYGLGAAEVSKDLVQAGCRDFFVSTWAEAGDLGHLPDGSLAVLHGFQVKDDPLPGVRPVLISLEQVARWKQSSRAFDECDVMVDTGMNRLGLAPDEIGALPDLHIHTFHSHLACADEDHPLNLHQLNRFRALRDQVPARRYSLANSAGIFLGPDYAFDLVRPGLAIYGGIPRPEARGLIRAVCFPEAQIVQVRDVRSGESVGYSATFRPLEDMRVAVLNIGYADGYWRAFSNAGSAHFEGAILPVVGRVSMDLATVDISAAPHLTAGDWVGLDFDLAEASSMTGFSQYELLTGLGSRLERVWS